MICIKDVACTEMKLKIQHCLNRESEILHMCNCCVASEAGLLKRFL